MQPGAGPKVSAILPAHNAESFIRDSIDSVLRQTYRCLELVVVDDGSTDGTGDIIAEYSSRDSRVVHLRQANRGVAAARNQAIAAARGRYIAPIDADDIWFPEKIAKQVGVLECAPSEVALAYAWSVRLDAAGQQLPERYRRPQIRGWVYPAFVYKNFCSASAPLIRRDCLDAVGAYDPHLREQGGQGCEDLDLLLRLAEQFKFELVPEYLLGYRQWPGSMSCSMAFMERSFRLVLDRVIERHPELPSCIVKWARSEFYLHLLHRAKSLGEHRRVLRYTAQAIRYDPGLVCVPHLHRCGLAALVEILRGEDVSPQAPTETAGRLRPHKPSFVARWRRNVALARIGFVSELGQVSSRSPALNRRYSTAAGDEREVARGPGRQGIAR